MKSSCLVLLVLIGTSAAYYYDNGPLDGHKKLHQAMRSILHDLSSTKLQSELQNQLNRTQQELVSRIHPYLTRIGIRIKNPRAYHSLLHHLLYAHSRDFVNTSKALDNMAQTSVLQLHKAQMLNTMIKLHSLQRNLAVFFNELHNYISQQAQELLRKHGVRLGLPHIHFLIHISAQALFRGKNVREVVVEHLRVVADQKMSANQRHRLQQAAVELALKVKHEVRKQLHFQIKNVLAKKTPITATHPIFIHSALHHFKPLMHHCPKGLHHLLGSEYNHYKDIAKKALGPHADHHVMMRIHGYVGPITLEHMNRVAVILKRYHQQPQHSVIGYLGAYHLRPDDEVILPWYKCLLKRMRGLIRVAWLVLMVVLGTALLGTAILVILSKKRRKKVIVMKKAPVKSTNKENSSKLPYISLVEEKVPIEA